MTGDELIRHRLEEFEKWRMEASSTLRQAERDVDLQKLEMATVKSLLVELKTETQKNDEHARASLARLHQRLDEVKTADTFERGREAGTTAASSRTWTVVAWTVGACIGVGGLVVGVLTLVLT